MSKRNRLIIKCIVAFGIISATTTVGNIMPVSAISKIESELISITDKYELEDVIVEEGLSLRKGEKLDLSDNPNWEMSNENTVQISEDGIVTPINSGTVFLSQKIGDKVHIIEVYVPREKFRTYSFAAIPKLNKTHYKVFIDPGHGGKDDGAFGNGNFEDELNLKVAKKVEKKLIDKGIEVKMSRSSDEFISLQDRANMANIYKPDLFISIHQNSAENTSAYGIETYYHTKKIEYKDYAQDIQSSAIKQTGARDRGVKSANFAVLRETDMPSALFESGFITNKNESSNLADSKYQEKLANGIVDGIEKYLKENIPIDDNQGGVNNNDQNLEVIDTGIVTAESLNIRSGAGATYSKIGTLSKGDKVEIVEKLQNGWYKIKYDRGCGYVSGKYIKIDLPANQPNVQQGWKLENGYWYYIREDGKKATGWLQLNGNWYFLENEGKMVTGWKYIEGSWYFFEISGSMATGWREIDNNWYFFYESGRMAVNTSIGSWVIGDNGVATKVDKGWKLENGYWYYIREDGKKATGWLQLNGNWYFLENEGKMVTGWKYIEGSWYFFEISGSMATGWREIDNNWYFFYESGRMAVNTSIGNWVIGDNGVATLK